jgi:hypothetical protein
MLLYSWLYGQAVLVPEYLYSLLQQIRNKVVVAAAAAVVVAVVVVVVNQQ